MFKLVTNPTFRTTASIVVPTDDGPLEQTLKVRFRMLPPEAQALEVGEFLDQAVLEIDDLVDEAGGALVCDEAMRATLLALPFVRMGLVKAYWAALSGARAGN